METHQQILIGPRPKIFPEFVDLLFFRLLLVQEITRKSQSVEEMMAKSECLRIFHGDAKFVEED